MFQVQILGTNDGKVFHFFERECSIQRRHQKVIEEAPSPFIGDDENLRKEICETAVGLARAVDYNSAGTVEFIMGEDRKYYFLEMNTRIQVEHPITEEITGFDLVANMIKSALGDPLDINDQSEVSHRGHSIECRICSEDPITMLPAPGKILGLETDFPQGTRFDHCLRVGTEITSEFDPMVGKLITTGLNREVAIRKMASALDGLKLYGLRTNIKLLQEMIKDDVYKSGIYTTQFIEKYRPQDRISTDVDMMDLNKFVAALEASIVREQ